MSGQKLGRRQFLQFAILRPVSLPILLAIGCTPGRDKGVVLEPELSPEESLKKLILLLGPWPRTEKEKADNFASRFLNAEHAVTAYLPGSNRLVQDLAHRFPSGVMAIKKIDLGKLSAKERELLIKLTKQLYSFIEIRFHVSGEPPWGECQPNRTLYQGADKT
jgi:hypothetical protein